MAQSAKDRKKARQMAEAIGSVVGNQEVRDFKNALGVNKSVRLRQGYCFAVEPSENTCSIWLSGEETTGVDGVRYFDVLPAPDYGVWCATDGEDIFIIASQGPAPVIQLGRSATQSIDNNVNTTVIYQDPSVSGNNGYDAWQAWTSSDSDALWLPAPGVWDVSGIVTFNNTSNSGFRGVYLALEGSDIFGRDDYNAQAAVYVTSNPHGTIQVPDASNSYIEMQIVQGSGAALSIMYQYGAGISLTARWLGIVP